jgi:biopolymer transport protein ExbD/biopolymer transport protein TolR
MTLVTLLAAVPLCTAQTLQKGISVQLAATRNAVAMPDADREHAVIVAVTHNGDVYLGIDPITPAALAEKRSLAGRTEGKLYVKADARTPYADVMKVLGAVRTAGVTAPKLLTGQQAAPQPSRPVPPYGLEVRVGPPLPSARESTVVQMLKSEHGSPMLKINNREVSWEMLRSRLRQSPRQNSFLVEADGVLPFSVVVRLIDVCRSTGADVFLGTPAT